ncbi:ASCH domain-containing protein [Lysinibacillus sphaericus]|uniref:Putative cytoplasmic protein n=1 Tax=Lysinibacillus sphaericus OT4b.31 TaxID=1285586 RepID=R7ZBB4_LYSSH|nr:ASCH domain-containing protein [Lysinibacillus sphaericus]EON71440.1 Putative cytoplasmic protein [Lysinibacillus sphaericus OT4b.31]
MSVSKIEEYWRKYASENDLNMSVPDAWMFGDGSKEMGDGLGSLVVNGIKTGTCAAHCVYELEEEEIQKVGQYDIVLDGDNNPLAVIKYTKVELVKMNEVTNDFARSEGEGDLSYDYWYREHVKFFTWELSQYGLPFTPDILLVCQTFKVMNIYKDEK